jgi:hypothetical protein
MSNTSLLSSSTKILPRKGDRVRIDGLKGAKEHNGKFGTVKNLASVTDRRYCIKLFVGSKEIGVRLSNLTVCCENESLLHVLIPCHINTDRRFVTFQRTIKSIIHQRDATLKNNTKFSVFIGLSGSKNYRTKAFEYLAKTAQIHNSRWYLQDDEIDARPQMEHLRSLLIHGSIPVNPQALLTFLDNDDMCHPLRFHLMMDAYTNLPFDSSEESYTLAMPCKLLLDPSITPSEGQLENFVNMECIQDFKYWRKNSFASRKIQLATNDSAQDLDCEEYFDFIVPSDVLKKFFDLNPTKVTSHKFCDLRLFQILYELCPIEVGDAMMPGMWLLAHYKIPMDEMRATFDRNGKRDTDRLVQSVDQASFMEETQTSADQLLAEKYPNLSPGKVAMCRGHLESIILSYIGWNERMLEKARIDKIAELDRSHGSGFGEELWEEVHSTTLALFDSATLEASKGAW